VEKIKIVIADDHALFREGVRALLSAHDHLDVVGEAADGSEAIEQVKTLRPHILLLDIAMPGLGGLETTLELKKVAPEVKIVILTQYANKEYLFRFLKAGVSGYVLKRAAGSDLIGAIKAVHSGGTFIHPDMAPAVIEGYLGGARPAEEEDWYENLTDREKQVFKLVAEGKTNKEIAEMLSVSVKTAMAHRAHVNEKLGIHNKAELVKLALQRGIIS
jgi:two-component system, NarL family, response regulator NreC